MKMIVNSNDIYDIQINDINLGSNSLGCPSGYSDFKVDVDDVTQDDNEIIISISGTCTSFGYHNPMPCTFEGTLTMNESDFTYEYTNAAEDGDKYITFEGDIEILDTSGQGVDLDADYDVEDTFECTMRNIQREVEEEVEDGSYITDDAVKYIIEDAADKIIEEIKHIDNIDIDKDKCVDYVLENILDHWHYSIEDNKYKSIDTILNAQAAEEIKNGELEEAINDMLNEIASDYKTEQEITAKVFFSDLDP